MKLVLSRQAIEACLNETDIHHQPQRPHYLTPNGQPIRDQLVLLPSTVAHLHADQKTKLPQKVHRIPGQSRTGLLTPPTLVHHLHLTSLSQSARPRKMPLTVLMIRAIVLSNLSGVTKLSSTH